MSRKVAFISDIHSNYQALKATLDKFDRENIHDIYILGDIVGYYSQPNETIDLLRERGIEGVMGNHDFMVVSKILEQHLSGSVQQELNEVFDNIRDSAREVIFWTSSQLTDQNMRYLLDLPYSLRITIDGINFLLVHGAPEVYGSEISSYTFKKTVLRADPPYPQYMRQENLDVVVVGHTHIPFDVYFEQSKKRVINSGSVGQPRDGLPFPSCAVVEIDSGVIKESYHLRIRYDISETQFAAWQSFLPWSVVQRLMEGL